MKSAPVTRRHAYKSRKGWLPVWVIMSLTLTWLPLPADSSPIEPTDLIDRYCADCHNAVESNGEVDFDSLNPEMPSRHPEVWERVILKLRHRQMPPLGESRPDDAGYEALAGYLEKKIDLAAAASPKPGRTAMLRRLTRTEYQNSIRELLHLDLDVSDLLPADPTSHGFDTITTSTLSPTLLQSYLKAAKKITQMALGYDNGQSSSHTIRIPLDRTQDQHQEGTPFGTRGGATVEHYFPQTGTYLIQLRLTRDRYEEVEGLYRQHQLELLVDGLPLQSFKIIPP
ncbi:MAG: DUF1587 domain-containing protein, partial [Boseongicola sp.]|nr:DUF1587 domain-containing protein [Boseongicola sp.]